jgi:predicted amidohydrolase YtcJ
MACAKFTADRIMIKDGIIHAEGSYKELEKRKTNGSVPLYNYLI